jgi:hypothetical protein
MARYLANRVAQPQGETPGAALPDLPPGMPPTRGLASGGSAPDRSARRGAPGSADQTVRPRRHLAPQTVPAKASDALCPAARPIRHRRRIRCASPSGGGSGG